MDAHLPMHVRAKKTKKILIESLNFFIKIKYLLEQSWIFIRFEWKFAYIHTGWIISIYQTLYIFKILLFEIFKYFLFQQNFIISVFSKFFKSLNLLVSIQRIYGDVKFYVRSIRLTSTSTMSHPKLNFLKEKKVV